jgi:peptidoglycan/xylan/chitin deacetylase (PgdA/CDA1 family)
VTIGRRIDRMIEKNREEARALVTLRMPRFVLGGDVRDGEVPVFVFHDVEPERFERQLRHLVDNGYRTLDADGLLAADVPPRSVVLTFDDATWTFHAHAFPLLRRYECRAVLFAIPALVPDDPTDYPTLDDERSGAIDRAEIDARARKQPLCTRAEITAMHASGLVDVQSHSLTHQRVPIRPEIVDFLHPGFDADTYGNVRIPLSASDDPACPSRPLTLGAPVFRSAPRLAGRTRFVEDETLVRELTDRVRDGERFFDDPRWRNQLSRVLEAWPPDRRGTYEREEETEQAIRREIEGAKRALEGMLPGKRVRHLCYPWFTGSALADRIADASGHAATYYGLLPPRPPANAALRTVARVSEVYLRRLPGAGRQSLAEIWRAKLTGEGRSG